MTFEEWRKLYRRQAEFEGWKLASYPGHPCYISSLVSYGLNIRYGFDSEIKAEEYVKRRAIVDRDPAAIHALEIIDSERVADKLSK